MITLRGLGGILSRILLTLVMAAGLLTFVASSPAGASAPRGSAATLDRLYQAYFDRAPDAAGLGYWVGRMETDLTLLEIAETFEASAEFRAKYGSLSDSEFVDLIYRNVLDRAPDQGGLDHWIGQLSSGGRTRSEVMIGFSESTEFVLQHSVDSEQIRRLYLAYFLREPDGGGFSYWLGLHANGSTLDQISSMFEDSAEFVSEYGKLSDADFVRQVYRNVLDREPEGEGFAYWVGRLESGGLDRGQLMTGFSESDEFRISTAIPDPDPDPEPDPDPDPDSSPVARDDQADVYSGESVVINWSGNDDLLDNAALGAFDSSTTKGGVIENLDSEGFRYAAAADFVGEDTFSYELCDDDLPVATCDSAVVTVVVTAPPATEPSCVVTASNLSVGVDETSVELSLQDEDCFALYGDGAEVIWSEVRFSGSDPVPVQNGLSVLVSGSTHSTTTISIQGRVRVALSGHTLLAGHFSTQFQSVDGEWQTPTAYNTFVYYVNPLGEPTGTLENGVCQMVAYGSAATVQGDTLRLNVGSNGNCEPERFNAGVQLVFDVWVDGVSVPTTLDYNYFRIESGRPGLGGAVFLPSTVVGADGDLDLTGSITLLDAEGEPVAELILDNEVAVNGFDPALPPVPEPTAGTCIFDPSEMDIHHGSLRDGTAFYWVGETAPPTVSTIHVETPTSCGGEQFAYWDQPGREVDVRIHLSIGSDRVFWGTGTVTSPHLGDRVVFVADDWILASSISAENTISIHGHVEYRGVDGELIALAVIDREIPFSG